MRDRGAQFWAWANAQLHCREHEERVSDGSLLDVKVRLSMAGETQLFVGVYDKQGHRIHETFHPARPGETMTFALAWGVEQARAIISDRATPDAANARKRGSERKTHKL